MICITVSEQLEYSVVYWLEGVKATEVLSKDKSMILKEIEHKLALEMGLARGKMFTNYQGV